MNTAVQADIAYFAQQPAEQIQWIISGMAALMRDTEGKATAMQSQNWFQRMVKTVSGKNRLTLEEIKRNHEQLNLYMAESITELYRMNCVDQRLMMSLGTQLNEIYAAQFSLREMLGAFVEKLNAKIDSVDNFHMLVTEIEQGVYTSDSPIVSICKVLSQFDNRILEDTRKLDIIRRSLVEKNILVEKPILLTVYLQNLLNVPLGDAGQIYLELGAIHENFIAAIMSKMMENYHFLPEMARKTKNRASLVAAVMQGDDLDPDVALSASEIYDDFVNSKLEVKSNLLSIVANVSNVETVATPAQEDTMDTDGDDDGLSLSEVFALAEQGDVEAQLLLGHYFDLGEGDDALQAEAWFRKAAEQGNAEAQFYLGLYLYHGDGTGQDLEQAVTWYRAAAEKGYAPAQHSLGECLFNGIGTKESVEEAVSWYKIAAQQGYAPAQALLGKCYENGVGVQKNVQQAVEWYRQSAEQEWAEGKFYLATCYLNGIGVVSDSVRAVELLQEAAEQEYGNAIAVLGICYKCGTGVVKDIDHAVALFRQAAEQENAFAQTELGCCYMYGTGVVKNLQTAREWLQLAVQADVEWGRAHYLYAETLYAIYVHDNLELSKLDIALIIPGVNFGAWAVKGVLKADEIKKLRVFLHTKEGRDMVQHYQTAAQLGETAASDMLKKIERYL